MTDDPLHGPLHELRALAAEIAGKADAMALNGVGGMHTVAKRLLSIASRLDTPAPTLVVGFHATILFQAVGAETVQLSANAHSALLHDPKTFREIVLFRPRSGAEWSCETIDFLVSDQASVDIAAAILGAMRPVAP